MKNEELTLYEMPTFMEFISIGWLQDLCAKYLAWRVNYKLARYKKRLELKDRVMVRMKQ